MLLATSLQPIFFYRFQEKDVKKDEQVISSSGSDIMTPKGIPAVIIAGTQKGVSHSIIFLGFYFYDSCSFDLKKTINIFCLLIIITVFIIHRRVPKQYELTCHSIILK